MFQNTRKLVLSRYAHLASSKSLSVLRGLPFYNWQNPNDTNTFNHFIGLPQKDGQAYPLFDYESMLYDTLQNHKHIFVKKATGLGITELTLRYMAWLCLRDDSLRSSQMCIVVGPNIDKAIELIRRMKYLFYPKLGVLFDSKETVLELNGVRIEAYPSHHLDAMRSLTNPKFIFLDEADFFPPGQQRDARDVSERYIAKSKPTIIMVSTPNAPEGLFEAIENEPQDTCLYHRIFLDYTYGLDKIYTEAEIALAKASPSFGREYDLKYLGNIGNVLHTKNIEAAMDRGLKLSVTENSPYTSKSMGIDPGFGSSSFGICITELRDGIVNVLHAEEYPRPDYNLMIETALDLIQKYEMTIHNGCRIFCDGANPEFISSLKSRLVDEEVDFQRMIKILKSNNPGQDEDTLMVNNMFVIPTYFNRKEKEMLAHVKRLMEYGSGSIAINSQFSKLIIALRTATEDGKGGLDKKATSHSDVFDAFRMSLQYWVSKGGD